MMIIEMVWRKGCKGLFVLGETGGGGTGWASVASVSEGFGSKERPRNGVFDVLLREKWGESYEKVQNVENPVSPAFFATRPHGNACYAG